MSLEVLKALSNLVPQTLKEVEKITATIEKTLREHPELKEPFKEYMKRNVGNFEWWREKNGTIKYR